MDNYLIWLCAVDYMMEELNLKKDNLGKDMYDDFLNKEINLFIIMLN